MTIHLFRGFQEEKQSKGWKKNETTNNNLRHALILIKHKKISFHLLSENKLPKQGVQQYLTTKRTSSIHLFRLAPQYLRITIQVCLALVVLLAEGVCVLHFVSGLSYNEGEDYKVCVQ